jgi:hypothetical protein
VTGGAPIVAGLGGVLLFLAAGLGLVELLPALRERPLAARLGWSYLLGVGAVAGSTYVLGIAFDVRIRRGVVLAPAVIFVVAGLLVASLRRGARYPSLVRPPLAGVVAARAAFGISALIAVGLFAAALTQPNVGFDGEMAWCAAARWIRADHSVLPRALTDPRAFVSHPRYPVLMPLAQVAVQETFDLGDDRRAVKPLYAAFFPALLLVLFDLARRRAGVGAAALATVALALVPVLAFTDSGGADGTFSDVPLGAFFGAGFLLLLLGRMRASEVIAAAVLLGAAVLTKNEGLPFAAAALLAVAFFVFVGRPTTQRRRRLAVLGIAAAAVFVAALALRSWQGRIPQRWDEDYAGRIGKVSLVTEARLRLPLVPAAILKEMANRENFAGFPLACVVILAAGAGGLRRRIVSPVVLCLYFCLGAYVLALLLTTWGSVDQVHPTWDRFLMQVSLPLGVLLALALRPGWRALVAIGRSAAHREAALAPGGGTRRSAGRFRVPLVFLAFALLPVFLLFIVVALEPGKASATARRATRAAAPTPTASPWKEDASLLGGVDEPAEGSTVHGQLDVRGWARFAGKDLSVIVLVDGNARPSSTHRRLSRLDVQQAIPSLGDCAQAGYEVTYSFSAADAGPHELDVIFRTEDGRERHYPARRFTWNP